MNRASVRVIDWVTEDLSRRLSAKKATATTVTTESMSRVTTNATPRCRRRGETVCSFGGCCAPLLLTPALSRERIPRNEIPRFEAFNRSVISRIGLVIALFPLTLALSLGERELHRPFGEKPESVDRFQIGMRFSLSPRERVGVRGFWCCGFMERENPVPHSEPTMPFTFG